MKGTYTPIYIILLIFTLLLSCGEEADPYFGNAVVVGEIVSLAEGMPVADARVTMCPMEVILLKEGIYIKGGRCDSAEYEIKTDESGMFEIPMDVDTFGLPTYVWLTISHPDYEIAHETYVHVGKGGNSLGKIALRNPGGKTVQNLKRHILPRKREIFTHDVKVIQKLYQQQGENLPSADTYFPEGNYARYFEPLRGYNTTPGYFKKNQWLPAETIILPMDIAMAGVTEGEIGEFTAHPEALKTQIIWARTYALYKALMLRVPQNFQMAFQTTITDYMLRASEETSKMILTHPNAPGGVGYPINAVYSAQCNGDFTQSGRLAKWSGCKVGGSWVPYLIAVECSGHPNCHDTGMAAGTCCNIDPDWGRYVYGHGAGGCQHGMRDFAEGNYPTGKAGLPHTIIAPYFFYGSTLIQFKEDVWKIQKREIRSRKADVTSQKRIPGIRSRDKLLSSGG